MTADGTADEQQPPVRHVVPNARQGPEQIGMPFVRVKIGDHGNND